MKATPLNLRAHLPKTPLPSLMTPQAANPATLLAVSQAKVLREATGQMGIAVESKVTI